MYIAHRIVKRYAKTVCNKMGKMRNSHCGYRELIKLIEKEVKMRKMKRKQ